MDRPMKYVVMDECELGYINPDYPDMIVPFAIFTTKGAMFRTYLEPHPIGYLSVVRSATIQDFDEFRVSPIGHLTPIN